MTIKIGNNILISNVVVCEDVRPEPGGKWSVLGAFSGDIVVTQLPGFLRIGIYADGEALADVNGPLSLRVKLAGTEVMKVDGQYEAKKGQIALPIPGLNFPISGPGKLQFEFSEDQKTWFEIAQKSVTVGAVTP